MKRDSGFSKSFKLTSYFGYLEVLIKIKIAKLWEGKSQMSTGFVI